MEQLNPAPSPDRDVEIALVNAFVVPAKRRRVLELLSNPKRRATILKTLYHFRDLDRRFATVIPASQQSVEAIEALLSSRGAPKDCYVVSTNRAIDSKRMPLRAVLAEIVGMGDGTLVSCIPGCLGYFESEEKSGRWLLERH